LVATEIVKMAELLSGMGDLVEEIKVGSQEQVRGVGQIAKAILQVEQSTQRGAANAEESAAAAQQLGSQSQVLRDISANLAAMVGMAGTTGSLRRPA